MMEDDKKLLEFLVSTLIQNVAELGLEIRPYRRVMEASDPTLLAGVTQAIAGLRESDARDSHDEMRRKALRAATDRNLTELSTVVGHLLSAARTTELGCRAGKQLPGNALRDAWHGQS